MKTVILNPVLKLVDYQILKLKIESDDMSKWYYKLTKILSVRKDIDYIMCIDENGSSSNLTYVLKQISNEKELSEDDKFFTITGCIFTREEHLNSKRLIKILKNKYWNNGIFYDTKVKRDKAVCFH